MCVLCVCVMFYTELYFCLVTLVLGDKPNYRVIHQQQMRLIYVHKVQVKVLD